MAEPLKNSFSLDVIDLIADAIARVHPDFARDDFIETAGTGFLDLELTPRARQISETLAAYLPDDRREALRILTDSLGPPLGEVESDGMASFVYLPHVFFVAEHGLSHFEEAMAFQYQVTRRFTAEFSIRAFLDRYPGATLDRLWLWTKDPDMHVRRLVSEGTRPRLPWAPRLQRFIDDPEPVLALLERLKDDPTEYVRRSVANNLNDISKDHPDLVVDVLSRWIEERTRSRLVRHAIRTLVKQGHPGAQGLLGYGPGPGVTVDSVLIEPDRVRVGGNAVISAILSNRTNSPQSAVVDLRVHFVKANGATNPKVFKGKEMALAPGESDHLRKTISLARHTTRVPHPGMHLVELLVNGSSHEAGGFVVTPQAEITVDSSQASRMRAEIREQLQDGHRIDITTIGRRRHKLHRVEIGFQNIDGTVYMSGVPGRRDWYANLIANPEFTFHLKRDGSADLPARARPITDPEERRSVLTRFTANWNYQDQLEDWVARSPLMEVSFDDGLTRSEGRAVTP